MVNEEMLDKYLLFTVDETYAVEIDKVVEIIEMQKITRVPETPSYIAGITNLRGHILPVIDIRERFKKEKSAQENERPCIIIVNFEDLMLGLLVDNVVDLVEIQEDKITPPPTVGVEYSHVFIKAIGMYHDRVNLVIDSDKLVNYSELNFVNQDSANQQI